MSASSSSSSSITVDVHSIDNDGLLDGILSGLTAEPRTISSRFFYDDIGSRLFERICELPEYYQTRTERSILRDNAGDIAGITEARALVELGSGAATKTRVLLDALSRKGTLRTYIPFDVSEGILRRSGQEILEEYDGIGVHGVVGDFLHHLEHIPAGHDRLVVILGGTLGNLPPEEAAQFVADVAAILEPGEHFLVGFDLIKDPKVIEAAYNDREGITAQFNKNALRVLNKELQGNFNVDAFEHVARYNEYKHRIEMWLRSRREQIVELPGIELSLHLARGEEIRTEISTKYDPARIEAMLGANGFEVARHFTDADRLFGLALARKTDPGA